MRRFLIESALEQPDEELEDLGIDLDPEAEARRVARRLIVLNDGPKCAAWLVKKHRRQLRTKGAIRFVKWKKQELPPWFPVAIAFLSERAGWEVTEHYEQKNNILRVWTVKWINRGHFRSVISGMRNPA